MLLLFEEAADGLGRVERLAEFVASTASRGDPWGHSMIEGNEMLGQMMTRGFPLSLYYQ